MNDNDIIKALECCRVGKGSYSCKKCPLFCRIPACQSHLAEAALDLINRQKAEIEKYEKEHNEKFNKWMVLDERTKERYAELYEEAKGVVRAEAIKEFSERLKEKEFFVMEDEYTMYVVSSDDIDALVKQMTEGEA